jgi:hypothetical protein
MRLSDTRLPLHSAAFCSTQKQASKGLALVVAVQTVNTRQHLCCAGRSQPLLTLHSCPPLTPATATPAHCNSSRHDPAPTCQPKLLHAAPHTLPSYEVSPGSTLSQQSTGLCPCQKPCWQGGAS